MKYQRLISGKEAHTQKHTDYTLVKRKRRKRKGKEMN